MGANASVLRKSKFGRNGRELRQNTSSDINDKESLKPLGYQLQATIGKGSYGKVKRAYSKKHQRFVAVKIVDLNNMKEDCRFIRREKQVTYVANHINIVKCFEILECGPKIYMVLEHIDNGDLCRYLRKKKFIAEPEAQKLFKGMLSAISYLHSKNVAHRDIKLENVLLTKDMVPKLSDFGFAKRVRNRRDRSETFCGSKMYSCFEILAGIPYNIFKADIWSLGVILFTMITGFFPFSEVRQLLKMREGVSFIGSKQDISIDVANLIRHILQTNPHQRYSIQQIHKHKWFRNRLE
ncbi:testis-specific serine/threonine-protein kinase 3-like [Rhopilema esculentum]|uniref:testis-specific serine/threonine-protein kinase 3-like n=1 Tax=Rhopilema esculentum TaxID=499914 RepID=UPI0031CDE0E5